jgi:hypothetical protein
MEFWTARVCKVIVLGRYCRNALYYTYAEAGPGALLAATFRGTFLHHSFAFHFGLPESDAALHESQQGNTVSDAGSGLAIAMLLHSLWNLSASLMQGYFFAVYLIVWVPLFFIFLGFVVLLARREKRIIRRLLAVEEGGLMTNSDVELAGSLRRRLHWLLAARNRKQFSARRRYLHAVTRLAFCYWHAERAASESTQTVSLQQIPRFRAEIAALKPW